jgi:formylmethanofuran dehydrogenase subunit E
MEFRFIKADCGHAITMQNIAGKCMKCGSLCCKECLMLLDSEMLCPRCFIERLKK